MSPTAVVTGGARGIGLACAMRLARQGAHVELWDTDQIGLHLAGEQLATLGLPHTAAVVDVAERDAVSDAVETLTGRRGSPLIVVNAAGILRGTRILEITDSEWTAVLRVCLTGAFVVSQACLPAMRAAGFGRIVNISSTAGKTVSTLGGAHYTAAKSGLLGLTRAMAKETAGWGVTVNAVCPGLIGTEMVYSSIDSEIVQRYAESFPIPRLGTPDEVAAVVDFLVSEDAAYITGAAVDINGGDLMV